MRASFFAGKGVALDATASSRRSAFCTEPIKLGSANLQPQEQTKTPRLHQRSTSYPSDATAQQGADSTSTALKKHFPDTRTGPWYLLSCPPTALGYVVSMGNKISYQGEAGHNSNMACA